MTRVLEKDLIQPLASAISDFVESCEPHDQSRSDEARRLVEEVFKLQYENDPAYRRLCQSRGVDASDPPGWDRIPMVPTAAFKSASLSSEPHDGTLIFRSSGTTEGKTKRSHHKNPLPQLYRTIIDAGYTAYCLTDFEEPPPTLSLIPSLEQVSDSSLGFMADHILREHSADDSIIAFSETGVDLDAALEFLTRRQKDGRPAMLLSTAFALVELLDHLAALRSQGTESPRLPHGSALFETGGFKGRTREIERCDLVAAAERLLGVPQERIVREYGMTELTSQLYSASLLGGDPELLVAPPWILAGVFDPSTLEPSDPGNEGLIGFFDLGNVASYPAVLTEDLGRMHERGLELLGRATHAELRGCSLTVEELQIAARTQNHV